MSAQVSPLPVIQPFVFFPGNTIPVLWQLIQGSTLYTTQTAVTDGVGTLTILDPNGNADPNADGLSFSPTSTAGLYQAIIPETFAPNEGINYLTVIEFTSASLSATGTWSIPTKIRYRATP